MIKPIIAGIWTLVVVLGSLFAATTMSGSRSAAPAGDAKGTAEASPPKKAAPLNVPMISGGKLQGYIVATFSYTLNPKAPKELSVAPEPFLVDEAFREIYSNPTMDFLHINKIDLPKLTKSIVQNVNGRLGGDVVQEVLVEEFNYVARDDIAH